LPRRITKRPDEVSSHVRLNLPFKLTTRLLRRKLLQRVQITLKPAPQTTGLHGIFVRCEWLKYAIADSAIKLL